MIKKINTGVKLVILLYESSSKKIRSHTVMILKDIPHLTALQQSIVFQTGHASRQTPHVTTLRNKELNHSLSQISVGILLSPFSEHNELSSLGHSEWEMCVFKNISRCQNNCLTSSQVTTGTEIQPELNSGLISFLDLKRSVQSSLQKSLTSSILLKVYLRTFLCIRK